MRVCDKITGRVERKTMLNAARSRVNDATETWSRLGLTACAAVALLMLGLAGNLITYDQLIVASRQRSSDFDAAPLEIVSMAGKRNVRRALNEESNDDTCVLRNTDLLLPLHSKDMPLVAPLLKSIEMNLPCFKDLVVVVPPESRDEVAAVMPTWAKIFVVPEPLPEQFGYLSQQVIKVYADSFTTGDYVFILEADMVFSGWEDNCFFGEEGKILAFCLDYNDRDKTDPIWKKGTEHAIWRTVEYDCVVNTPFIFPRDLFSGLRAWIKEVHGKSFQNFMEDYYEGHSKGWTPEDNLFSEFNIMNHYMFNFMEDQIQMVKSDDPLWDMTGKCSQHIGGRVERNHDLENPKLTSEYFKIAHEVMTKPVEHHFMPLDLNH